MRFEKSRTTQYKINEMNCSPTYFYILYIVSFIKSNRKLRARILYDDVSIVWMIGYCTMLRYLVAAWHTYNWTCKNICSKPIWKHTVREKINKNKRSSYVQYIAGFIDFNPFTRLHFVTKLSLFQWKVIKIDLFHKATQFVFACAFWVPHHKLTAQYKALNIDYTDRVHINWVEKWLAWSVQIYHRSQLWALFVDDTVKRK